MGLNILEKGISEVLDDAFEAAVAKGFVDGKAPFNIFDNRSKTNPLKVENMFPSLGVSGFVRDLTLKFVRQMEDGSVVMQGFTRNAGTSSLWWS